MPRVNSFSFGSMVVDNRKFSRDVLIFADDTVEQRRGGLWMFGSHSIKRNEIERFPVSRFTPDGRRRVEETVAREFPLTIVLNDQELVTLLCSPGNLDYLAVGYLYSEGLLKDKGEIKKITADDRTGIVRLETAVVQKIAQDALPRRLITSGGGRGAALYSPADIASYRVKSETKISTAEVFALVNEFQQVSEVYLATHGVHSAALADVKGILIFSEDIGRHNAVDKVFGRCFLEDIPVNDKILITSGRVSSEIIYKVAKRGAPIIISIAVPTDLGVKLAADLALTMIGSVKSNKSMNVYTNDWRIVNR